MRLLKLPLLGLFAAIALVTSASSCGKDPSFVFLNPLREGPDVSATVAIKEIMAGGSVDLLWVIDNSSSMGVHQQNVIANTQLFMNEFISQGLTWKSGLVSTDMSNAPFIGFTPSTLLDSSVNNPVALFQTAVSRLGLNGYGIEVMFRPILTHLKDYPGFLRPDVPLAIIIVSDAPEQSGYVFEDFKTQLRAIIGDRRLYAYGALNANDLGCSGEPGAGGFGSWNYAGSPYEQLIRYATNGKVFPLCTRDFGAQIAQVGREIVQSIQRSTIYLNHRPRLETIEISYKGTVLPPGPKEDGGYWMYDFGQNAIHFHDLSFSTDMADQVQLKYQKDDGLPAQ